MAQLNLNTRVKYDKHHAWEALVKKYFNITPEEVNPQQNIKVSMDELRQLSDESHEFGRVRERVLTTNPYK